MTAIDDLVFLVDGQRRFLNVWTGKNTLLFAKPEKLRGRTMSEIFGPELAQPFEERIQKAIDTGSVQIMEYPDMAPSSENWFQARIAPVNVNGEARTNKVVVAVRDISQRIKAERKLDESEKRFRDFTFTHYDVVWELDPEGRITYISEQIEKLLGYRSEELLGKAVYELHAASTRERAMKSMASLREHPVPQRDLECWLLTRDGRELCILSSGVPVFDEKGVFRGFRGTYRDVTEKKIAMEERFSYAERLDRACRAGGVVIWEWCSLNKQFVFSDNFYGILGYEPEEIALDDCALLAMVHHADKPCLRKAREEYRKPGGKVDVHYRLRAKNGEWLWFKEVGEGRFDAQGNRVGIFGVLVDLTSQKKMEDTRNQLENQLIRSEKLASIGTLVAGIAHEINNPLMIVAGHIDLIAAETGTGPEATKIHDSLEKQRLGIKRIKEIIDGLRIYSRRDDEKVVPINMHQVIEETLSLNQLLYKAKNLRIEKSFLANRCVVCGNSGRIQQVLMNLLSNAKDALEDRADPLIRIETQNREEGFVLRITDNGTGIPPEVLRHVFDPFFTTKAPGKGTGLGLAITQSIVMGMGGTIEAKSEISRGTSFVITLPCSASLVFEKGERTISESCAANPPGMKTVKLSGRALIVDDEAEIRFVLRRILEKIGLSVDEADDGDTALERLKENSYDFVITDMKMPRMNGNVFLSQARELNVEGTRFVVTTGGAFGDAFCEGDEVLRKMISGSLQKPFDFKAIEELLLALAR